MTGLRDALADIAERAPEVRVPAGFYRAARRRHRLRLAGSAAATLAVLVIATLFTPVMLPADGPDGVGSAPAGLPERIAMPPWWTETVQGEPAGPASVVFSAVDGLPQADHEDFAWTTWWRSGYTVYPSVVVGLRGDAYRVVRGAYTVGTELSPDGRYLLLDSKRVLDLTTGRARRVLPANPRTYTAGAWSADGTRILYVEDTLTTVVAWPSGRVEATFTHPDQRPIDKDLALSPDGSVLLVNSNEAMSAYRGDGTRLWTHAGNRDRLGGRAAWRDDRRLATFQRTDLACDTCGVHPGTWRLTFVDAATGVAVAGPEYPALRSALDVRILVWRADVAYAVVTYSRDGTDETDRVELVRLDPGAPAAAPVLTAPAGANSMTAATDHVDARRPTGEPGYGFNGREVAGVVATGALCLAPFVGLMVLFVVLGRRVRAG